MTSLSRDLALPILKNCFPEVNNVRIVNDQVEDGQRHFSSDVIRLTVEYEQDDETRRKYVVLKVPSTGVLISSFFERFDAFNKEIEMYEKVIPQINKYLDDSLSPAHLYTTDSKILVLEDLTARGYKSGEKLPLLNLHEAKGAMKTFAHFHAATHKAYTEVPHMFENFFRYFIEALDIMKVVAPWEPIVVELLRRKSHHHLIPKVEAAFMYLKKHIDKMPSILDKCRFQFVTLNHGDSRKENFMFKQSTNEVLVQFIDYQCCFISSPAYDLSIFLQSSVLANVLEAHFDELIDGYLCELNITLKKMGCASTYLRADFDQDFKMLKLFQIFGFIILCANVSPMDRQQIGNLIDSTTTSPDNTYILDACLNDEQFVLPVYGWLKYFEKSKISDEF